MTSSNVARNATFQSLARVLLVWVPPYWRCPSDGVHCIMRCASKYVPGTTEVVVTRPGVDLTEIESAHGNFGKHGVKEIIKVPKILSCR